MLIMKGFLPLDTNFIRVDTNWVSRLDPDNVWWIAHRQSKGLKYSLTTYYKIQGEHCGQDSGSEQPPATGNLLFSALWHPFVVFSVTPLRLDTLRSSSSVFQLSEPPQSLQVASESLAALLHTRALLLQGFQKPYLCNLLIERKLEYLIWKLWMPPFIWSVVAWYAPREVKGPSLKTDCQSREHRA